MKDSQFKTLQQWFETLNERMKSFEGRLGNVETHMATKTDIEKIHQTIDGLHGMIHQAHRRLDKHLLDGDSEKRLLRLALERLDDRVMALERRS